MSKLRVGVIGAGGWTKTCHIPYLQADGRANVVALCGRTPARVQQQAAEFQIPKTYTDHLQLIADPGIDAVTIATPNNMHASIAIAALKAGKHVFCEKPLGMNASETRDMLQAAHETNLVNHVAFTFRHLYSTNVARQSLAEGILGSVFRVEGYSEGSSGLNPNYPWNWRDSAELSGSGRLADMGSHVVDLAHYITGFQTEKVAGSMFTLHHWRPASNETMPVTTDDAAEFIVRFSSGAQGYFNISRLAPGEGRSFVQITGEKGALRVKYSRGHVDTVCHSGGPGQPFSPLALPAEPQHNHALGKMMSAFISACMGEKTPQAATFAAGHYTQTVLDAVLDASKRQAWTNVKQATGGNVTDLPNH